jgi:hypothetical protein
LHRWTRSCRIPRGPGEAEQAFGPAPPSGRKKYGLQTGQEQMFLKFYVKSRDVREGLKTGQERMGYKISERFM